MKEIKINKKFHVLREALTRYFVITGGRGSGKSYAICINLLLLTYEKGHNILFTRYTMTSAEISIIPEFLSKVELLGLEDDFHITSNSITNLVTGSKILFRGLKASSGMQTANLKSIEGVTTWVLDEAEELWDQDVFETIDESVRTLGRTNRVILILNPTTKAHWIHRHFFVGNGVEDGWNGSKGQTTYIHTSYLDNINNLSQSWLDKAEALKTRRPKEYEHRFLGGWLGKAKGAVFTNWTTGEWVETPDRAFGQDFGFSKDASTLVETSIDWTGMKIYVRQCFYKHKLKTQDIYELNKLYAGDHIIVADSAEIRLIEELSDLGNNIQKCVKGAGSVAFGIKLIQDFDVIVDPDSTELIEELNNYQWKLNKDDQPIDDWNHLIDAWRYAVTHLNRDRNTGEYYFD
jgi:phage terminase large subunit